MTQEDKELLLKDLCARLPYGTLVYAQNADDWYDDEISSQVLSDVINEDYIIKPYLFPLSGIDDVIRGELVGIKVSVYESGIVESSPRLIDFYNKHHLDYRGLIEKGLAIDATGLNIY